MMNAPHARAPVPALSVIVPVAPGDTTWRQLLPDLGALRMGAEVIVVQADHQEISAPHGWPAHLVLRLYRAPAGRARQQNVGAAVARGDMLWFVHADSRLPARTLLVLERYLEGPADALAFFDLRFATDGPRLAFLNAWGANLRSRWFGLPFGDQGLLLPRVRFEALGGFDETLGKGEDHLLVWQARHSGLPLRSLNAPILTSARTYIRGGWLRTTVRHAVLTLAQIRHARRILRGRRS